MTIPEILAKYRKIAVLGISPNEERPSHYVSRYMMENGYEICGVNPAQTEVMGRPCYATLGEVPKPLEIVAVFRASEYLPEIVREAIQFKPKVLWIQLGISDLAAEIAAEAAGIVVVRQRCLMVEHRNWAQ